MSIVISSIITNIQNQEYEKKIKQIKEDTCYIGIIMSNPIKREYDTQYHLKVIQVGKKNVHIMVQFKMQGKLNLEYGDQISFKGKYEEPSPARNDKGFDDKIYLKSNRTSRKN